MKLIYEKSADGFSSAFPLGNGNTGAMVYGGIDDKISLSDKRLWYRGRVDRNNPYSRKYLQKIRRLLIEKNYKKAQELVEVSMYPYPKDPSHNELLGEVFIKEDHGKITDYKRELDLENAMLNLSFMDGEVKFEREYLLSYDYKALFIKYKASKKNSINLRINLDRKIRFYDNIEGMDSNKLKLTGALGGEEGTKFALGLSLVNKGGKLKIIGDSLIGEDMDEALIIITSENNYENPNILKDLSINLRKLEKLSYDHVKKEHIKEYQSYFNKSEIHILDGKNKDLSLDKRLSRIKAGKKDLDLINLYLAYSKYLLISSSRPNSMPISLQGVWVDDTNPAWGGRYTLNINTQMNYWLARELNLEVLEKPLFAMLEKMKENGRHTAKVMFGMKGITAFHNTDGFFDTAPEGKTIDASIWNMSLPWLVSHIYENYLYSGDESLLKDHYGLFYETFDFLKDYLFEVDGILMTGPSISPENSFKTSDGFKGSICLSPAMDIQIIKYFLKNFIKVNEILAKDESYNKKAKEILKKLPPDKISKDGTLQEYFEDFEKIDKGHRHISHIFGLFPANLFDNDEKIKKAVLKTIKERLKYSSYEIKGEDLGQSFIKNGENISTRTGWSVAWILNALTRFDKGDFILDEIYNCLKYRTLDNLLDDHPPFQIDGNFGLSFAIIGSLIQSQNSYIDILPSLPKDMKNGFVKKLKARGNIEVSFIWKDGKVMNLRLKTFKKQRVKVKIRKSHTKNVHEFIFDEIIDGEKSIDF